MNLKILTAILIITMALTAQELQFATDRVLVKMLNSSNTRSVPDLGVAYSKSTCLNPSRGRSAKTRSADDNTRNNVFVLYLKETGKDAVMSAVETLNANPAVEIAEPVYIRKAFSAPNDPMYNLQYALQKINAEAAWEITTGDKTVVVGVMDTGIDGTHPDLKDNLWLNPEADPDYGDIHGFDFAQMRGGIPYDVGDHGTHVSGIIGAKGNNAEGISGINMNVSLAWLGVADAFTEIFHTDAIVMALYYADDSDIRIINGSFGGFYYSKIEEDAYRDYSGLFIAAAGNESQNNDLHPSFPANYDLPNIITVASTDQSDALSYFSNHGAKKVHIAAPGSNILSTVPNNDYARFNGTSMAAPYVTGVAALVKAVNPELTTLQLRDILTATARKSGSLYGFGFLDAHAALTYGLEDLRNVAYHFNDTVVRVKTVSDKEPIAPANPTRDGYLFAGWLAENDSVMRAQWVESASGMYATEIPDGNFRNEILRVLNAADGGNRTQASIFSNEDKEILASVSELGIVGMGISDLTGLEYFTGLTRLRCGYNKIRSLDLSKHPNLAILNATNNQISSIDLSQHPKFQSLAIGNNLLTSLDVSGNPELYYLTCGNNRLSSLAVSNNPALETLYLNGNKITSIDLSNNPELADLNVSANLLTELDLSENPKLGELTARNNRLTKLILSSNPTVSSIDISHNLLTEFDLSGNLELQKLNAVNNRFTELDVNGLNLVYLDVQYNYMTAEEKVAGVDEKCFFYFAPQHLPGYISAVDIYDYPKTAKAGVPLDLTADIFPANADGQNIVWYAHSFDIEGISIIGNQFLSPSPGWVYLVAAIEGDPAFQYSYYIYVEPADGTDTAIRNIKKSDSRHGIRFTNNIVSDKAEIFVEGKIVKVVIYDMIGNVVYSGTERTWDLRNNAGRFVANGMYLVVVEVKDINGKPAMYSAKFGVKI